MFGFIIALALVALACAGIVIDKTFRMLPVKELKRRARAGNMQARKLYKAAAYGASLHLLLWLIVLSASAASFVFLVKIAPWPLAFLLILAAVGYVYIFLTSGRVAVASEGLAEFSAPPLAWILHRLHPILDAGANFVRDHRAVMVRTGLFEREDLLALLERQKKQPDSRFSQEELDLLMSALAFGQKSVGETMVPRREVRSISADEAVGPALMQELHDSGHSRFPVYNGEPDKFVGTLYLRNLINLHNTGHVRDHMQHAVYYVHEEYPLEQALHAFLKTKHHLFIVINKFEEYVGIITIEDIIEQILGSQIVDEFDAYDDIRAVAADHARRDHQSRQKSGREVPEPKPDEDIIVNTVLGDSEKSKSNK
jgi:CBS domain containing-hemolysin-like protein